MTRSLPISIQILRGIPVILDSDLARIYGVPTKRLNEQVKRNMDRFPKDFRFQTSKKEVEDLKSQFAASKNPGLALAELLNKGRGGRRTLPYSFTEHGALMAANVLNSPKTVKMSIFIIRAFIKQRASLATNQAILKRLAKIDKTLMVHDTALRGLYQKLLPLLQPHQEKSHRSIGFADGTD